MVLKNVAEQALKQFVKDMYLYHNATKLKLGKFSAKIMPFRTSLMHLSQRRTFLVLAALQIVYESKQLFTSRKAGQHVLLFQVMTVGLFQVMTIGFLVGRGHLAFLETCVFLILGDLIYLGTQHTEDLLYIGTPHTWVLHISGNPSCLGTPHTWGPLIQNGYIYVYFLHFSRECALKTCTKMASWRKPLLLQSLQSQQKRLSSKLGPQFHTFFLDIFGLKMRPCANFASKFYKT